MGSRIADEVEFHARMVGLVAKNLFPFPNEDHPTWKTYVNHPKRVKSVDSLYPDIVVIEILRNKVVMIGEVETESTITEDEATGKWKSYSALCSSFFLYVPKGLGMQAKELLDKLRMKIKLGVYDENGNIMMARY